MLAANPPVDALAQVQALLDATLEDEALRDGLEAFARHAWFPVLCPIYGPVLYRRNRAVFRSLLVAQLEAFRATAQASDPWRGPEGGALEGWLDAADEADDIETFRLLFAWRAGALPADQRDAAWRKELLRRFEAAEDQAKRILTLAKMNMGFVLDEPTAVALYERDPETSPGFVRGHMLATSGEARGYWAALSSLARVRRDEELFFSVYRKTVEVEQWARDVELLADRIDGAAELTGELKRRHPQAMRRNVSSVLYGLLRKRGEDVIPYALFAVDRATEGLQAEPARLADLIRLADERGWLGLWTRVLCATGRDADLDREVRRLVDDQRREEHELLRRLDRLARLRPFRRRHAGPCAGVVLTDETAWKMYLRFPRLLRFSFRRRMQLGPKGYLRLLDTAVRKQDELLTDYLASLVVVVDTGQEWAKREVAPMNDVLYPLYEALLEEPDEFVARVVRVFGFVSGATGVSSGHGALYPDNKLAMLFWNQDPSVYLAREDAMRDLLESPNVHVQHFALRFLASDDPRAPRLVRENLALVKPLLLLRLPRRVRRCVVVALENVAGDKAGATEVVGVLREAFELRAPGHPHHELVGLLGRLLDRYPSFCTPAERAASQAGPAS